MHFLYSILAFGFFLAAVPVLIHLINLMRHRRVQWAAMEFLLQSYRKHRKWVMLRQLILLLARVTAVILLVALLAQLEIQWPHKGMFSGTLTHHYVLVDDSMSTSDRAGGMTAFERGMGFVYQLGSEAARQESRQRFTLIRFSTAALARVQTESQVAAGDEKIAELNAVLVDPQFMLRLEEIRRTAEPTQLAVGPEAALRVVKRVMEQRSNERRILHVVSDFRSREWDNPRELRALLSDVERLGTDIRFVWSARGQQPNLAITGLQPAPETRASGVPLFMTVQVTNYGAEPQEKIPLRMRTFAYDAAAIQSGGAARPIAADDDLPLMQIDRINPYETVTQRVQVYFAEAGKHVVQAMLPEDAVPADNLRWCVVDFPEAETALVIDGDPQQRNAFYMQAIFEPGQRARTGVRPAVRDPSYLRDVAADALREYSAIYLCDVERLDDQALANLESYVRGGGGLAVFVGPQVNTGYYSQQFARNAAGLFPVPLDHDDLLDDDPVNDTPDLEVLALDHPLFRELVQGQNPIIRMIRVERFLRVEPGWNPAPDSGIRVLARLRNRAPLVVEKTFGEGRVIAFLTTYAPYWNDLALGPNVLLALRLQSYLGFARRTTTEYSVADPIERFLQTDKYQHNVRVFLPGTDPAAPVIVDRPAEKQATDSHDLVVALRRDETDRGGVYEMWLNRADGSIEADRYAVNVDAREGDLAQTPPARLLSELDPVSVRLRYADHYEGDAIEQGTFDASPLLLCLLISLLIGEQMLAYFTGFHPQRTALVARGTPVPRPGFHEPRDVSELEQARLFAAGTAGSRATETLPAYAQPPTSTDAMRGLNP